MIRRSLPALAMLALLAGCARTPPASAPAGSDPQLVVLISVDQLRGDLLQRYDRFFTGGFRRLMDQGAYFEGVHAHAGSETGPGHATLGTGAFPARSGIVANDWLERVDGKPTVVYNVQDTLARIVGGTGQEPGRSPANLLRPGLADWMLAQHPQAKVVSVSGKDRSAILMAARAKGQVFWFNPNQGRFITSDYYMREIPGWVERFQTRTLPALLDSAWVEQTPPEMRALAGADTAAYEGDAKNTFFPHTFEREGAAFGGSFNRWVATTPFLDRATLGLAREAIRVNGMGRDEVPDFLAVGLSQTDYVGHRYGPISREQADNLLRLDRELGEFFDYLDRTVGRGRWVAALSADHGANTAPEQLAAQGQNAFRISAAQREQMEQAASRAAASAPAGQSQAAVARALRTLPFVADAYTHDEIARGTPRDSFAVLYRNSYYPGRFGSDIGEKYGVELLLNPGVYPGGATGAGHVGPYFHDRWVPVIFLGAGVTPMRGQEVVRTADVAPTLARLAGIQPPGDLDGRPVLPARP